MYINTKTTFQNTYANIIMYIYVYLFFFHKGSQRRNNKINTSFNFVIISFWLLTYVYVHQKCTRYYKSTNLVLYGAEWRRWRWGEWEQTSAPNEREKEKNWRHSERNGRPLKVLIAGSLVAVQSTTVLTNNIHYWTNNISSLLFWIYFNKLTRFELPHGFSTQITHYIFNISYVKMKQKKYRLLPSKRRH